MREVFVDESSQNGHQFMAIGALVVPGTVVAQCEAEILRRLTVHGMFGEVKWTKVSPGKLHVYRDLCGCHFDLVRHHGVEFHCLILDTHKFDHTTYNAGDPELGFNKFLYRLLHYRVGCRFGESEKIVVHLDSRNTNREPSELRRVLNSAAIKKYASLDRLPFTRVAHRDSKGSCLIQLCDLFTGAIAWHKNAHDARDNASTAKTSLANEIARLTGRARLGEDTPKGQNALSVWNASLKPRKEGAR